MSFGLYLRLHNLYRQKKHIAFALLLAFVFAQSLAIGLHFYWQHYRTERFTCFIGDEQSTTLQFSKDEWSKIRRMNESEIILQGKLFDIHSISEDSDNVIVVGAYDKHEDKLIAVSEDAKTKEQSLQKATHFFTVLFFEQPFQYQFAVINEVSLRETKYSGILQSTFLKKESPPPEDC